VIATRWLDLVGILYVNGKRPGVRIQGRARVGGVGAGAGRPSPLSRYM